MASHCHCHHYHHHQAPPPPPPTITATTTTTQCCCYHNPLNTCCTTPPPQHHLLHPVASLLSQPQPHPILPSHQNYTKSHIHHNLNLPTQNHHLQHQHQTHSAISSLLHRIESLESSLNHYTRHSLRHTAATVIQTHFRSFLARRSRTLTQLKHLASIKSTFNALKSSCSSHGHVDFAALSLKAMNLLLELDSIEGCDPMIVDGKRSISRDLVRFLDSLEEVALRKHVLYVREARNVRSGKKVQTSRKAGDEERRKLLHNLRDRVEKLSRLCKVSANDEEDSESEGVTNVLIGGSSGVSPDKNGAFLGKRGVKKSVRFAENGNICEVYSRDVRCSDGSCSSSDEQGEVLDNVSGSVEDDGVNSYEGADDEEEVLVLESGVSDDGERSSRRAVENEGRNAEKEKLLFSAPLPLKMENRSGVKKT
ncbi:BAG family molecular chaperone regulator 8, chloroplastic [Vigna radiata var. radiata]|uniref:BAG family molecular chaperone regulator 8, chloroplastic n=1 Tax=Vigna radiata var. radiata TaxID=3916 RepID=A0A1S3TTE0_VIGRR|nr:BAG family molecular chaperone regulator 8, chloroplastic [Vigna radiata var. radiata]